MIKAVLFDVDGVVLLPRDKYFSQRVKADFDYIDDEKIKLFFGNQYKDIVVGKAGLRDELSKVIGDWGWKGTVDDLLEYWFEYENKVNQDVFNFAQELRQNGMKCYLASDHSDYRKQNLLKKVGLENFFDGAFFSSDLGYTKDEVEYFEMILKQLGFKSAEILFVDDDMKNVEVAKKIIPNSYLFTTIDKLKDIPML